MDFIKFLHISIWVLAIGSTLVSIIGAIGMYYYNYTVAGKMEVIMMQLKGRVPVYRWTALIIATFAWIALACFK